VEHVRALHNHIGPGLFDYVIYNSNYSGEPEIRPEWKVSVVKLDQQAAARFSRIEFVPADVVRDENPLRHDSYKLAHAVLRLYENRGGKGAPGRVRQRERQFEWPEATVGEAQSPEAEQETTKVS
jgi:hypothetical protein